MNPTAKPRRAASPPGLRTRVWMAGIAVGLAGTFGGCSSVTPSPVREPVMAMGDTAGTKLGRAVAADLAAHPGQSAFYPLPLGTEAFYARLALIRAAERSIDVQYYIFHVDETGKALIGE